MKRTLFNQTKEQASEARKNPEFTYVKMCAWSPHTGNNGGFILRWGAKYIGFGEIAFVIEKDTGKIKLDDECMGKDFANKVLLYWFDQIEFME